MNQHSAKKLVQPVRMQGQQQDEESGLCYNRYRYYDPRMGRYVSQDPIGLAGGVNIYSYANMNPIINIDPLGLNVWTWVLPAAGGLAAADGPLPFGEAVALILLVGAGIYSLCKSVDCASVKNDCVADCSD